MSSQIRIITSMATKHLVVELAEEFERSSGTPVAVDSAGGVAVVRRVDANEAFDVVVLASNVIDELIASGRIVAGSRVDIVRSGVEIAVKAGSPAVDIGTEEALRQAIVNAKTVGYSTGPSGVYLQKLFERWGIADTIKDRIVVAQPGVPVGQLIVDGKVELGFQQLSELIHLEGIDLQGPLPAPVQLITVFSTGIATTSKQHEAARALQMFMASSQAEPARKRNGLEAA